MSSPLLDCIEVVTGVGTPHHAVIWLHGLLYEIHELVKFDLIETPHPEPARLALMNRIGKFLGLHL